MPPSFLDAAMTLFREGRLAEARQALHAVLETDPTCGEAFEGLGYIAAKEHDYPQAADLLDRAVGFSPRDVSLRGHAAFVNQAAGRSEEALKHLEAAIDLAPGELRFHAQASDLLAALGRFDEALARIDHALRLAPGAAPLHYNRGKVLGAMGRFDQELQAYQRALTLRPTFIEAHVNAGVALRDLRRFDDALRAFKTALAIDPDHAGARTNRAQTNLLLGRFEHGWRDYEWRWRDGGQRHEFPGAPWLGEAPIAGKTLLVHSEQGLGDTLQFVRYLPALLSLGARVILVTQAPLLTLLQGQSWPIEVIGQGAPLPSYDRHVPLMSLPLALFKTAPAIPAPRAYLVAPETGKAQWAARLAGAGLDDTRLKVGLVWAGSRTHPDDRNRSASLAQWLPLLDADCHFISLQKEPGEDDRATLLAHPGIWPAGEGLSDFAETAGLIANLDVVICVDTSVAHLSGAMGRPTWLALPYTPDWRWQLDRDDSPWYGSMRLFRQTQRGDWAGMVARIGAALVAYRNAEQDHVEPSNRGREKDTK